MRVLVAFSSSSNKQVDWEELEQLLINCGIKDNLKLKKYLSDFTFYDIEDYESELEQGQLYSIVHAFVQELQDFNFEDKLDIEKIELVKQLFNVEEEEFSGETPSDWETYLKGI